MIVCGSTLLTMPVVMILSRVSGLANSEDALAFLDRGQLACRDAGEWAPALRSATRARFACNSATSFCGSAAISRAARFCVRGQPATARYSELATTCWQLVSGGAFCCPRKKPCAVAGFADHGHNGVLFSRLKSFW